MTIRPANQPSPWFPQPAAAEPIFVPQVQDVVENATHVGEVQRHSKNGNAHAEETETPAERLQKRFEQLMEEQEKHRDTLAEIWANRQKHEAERFKLLKETLDYCLRVIQEATVEQAMAQDKVNKMWSRYFRGGD